MLLVIVLYLSVRRMADGLWSHLDISMGFGLTCWYDRTWGVAVWLAVVYACILPGGAGRGSIVSFNSPTLV